MRDSREAAERIAGHWARKWNHPHEYATAEARCAEDIASEIERQVSAAVAEEREADARIADACADEDESKARFYKRERDTYEACAIVARGIAETIRSRQSAASGSGHRGESK